jgi:uncharacterized membrane protein
MVADPEYSPEEVEDGKALAAIGYLWVLFFLPLVVKPDNRFCRAHAKQALVLFIASAVLTTFSFLIIPFFGAGLMPLLIFVLQIVALVKTLQGQFWKIPGAWDIAERIPL